MQTLINLGSRYFGPRRSNAIVGDVLETPKLRASTGRRVEQTLKSAEARGSGWPGPESNRRPFTFQANATTD